jgi:hypothetical protein
MNIAKGSSLVELSCIIAIITVLALLVIRLSLSLDGFFIRGELQRLTSMVHYARQKALLSGKAQEITFNVHTNSYTLEGTKYPFSPTICIGIPTTIVGPPSKPETPIKRAITFPEGKMICYPNGNVSAGILYLTHEKTKTYYAFSVAVTHLMYVRLYKYTQGKWIAIS